METSCDIKAKPSPPSILGPGSPGVEEAGPPLAVCMQETSSCWAWTEGMMGMEQERNGGGEEGRGRRGPLRLLVELEVTSWMSQCTSTLLPHPAERSTNPGGGMRRKASCLG